MLAVRPMTRRDIQAVARVFLECGAPQRNLGLIRKRLKELAQGAAPTIVLVGTVDGQIVGVGIAHRALSIRSNDVREILLLSIRISPKLENRHVDALMVEELGDLLSKALADEAKRVGMLAQVVDVGSYDMTLL